MFKSVKLYIYIFYIKCDTINNIEIVYRWYHDWKGKMCMKNNKGFTLVEVAATFAILTWLLLTINV